MISTLPKTRRRLLCCKGCLLGEHQLKKTPCIIPLRFLPHSLVTALVIVSLSDNTGPRLFLFLLELPALVCSSTPFIMLCQGSDPSIYSIFTCAVKVVLLVTRMPTFVTEYCSFSQGQTPQSIALSLVLWRWFYLSQESPLSSLNTAVFLALSHYSSPAQSPSSSPLSPPAPEKKTDKTQVLSSFRWTSLIRKEWDQPHFCNHSSSLCNSLCLPASVESTASTHLV